MEEEDLKKTNGKLGKGKANRCATLQKPKRIPRWSAQSDAAKSSRKRNNNSNNVQFLSKALRCI